MKHTPTPEQAAIVEAAKDSTTSLMISALAGTAKTTTLELIANVLPRNQVGLALAFNRKIMLELEKRFPPNFTVMTLNGLGHRAWAKAIGKKLILNANKLGDLVTATFKDLDYRGAREDWNIVRELVQAAMQAGLTPGTKFKGLVADTDDNWADLTDNLALESDHISLARRVLVESIKQAFAGTISFDDQIYMSTMFGGVFPRFPLVMVDEAQDLSPLNHIQVSRAAAGRLIVVGDCKQAIYAFRGADSASMTKLRGLRPDWIDLPLSVTFRCPKKIVARQLLHAIGFTAFATNAEGEVRDLAKWTWPDIPTGDTAVLCRNNAPLLSLAFKLLRRNVGVIMLGRDIGRGLIALAKKLFPDPTISVDQCITIIDDWTTTQVSLAAANKQDAKVDRILDQADCLRAAARADGVATAQDIRENLERLFDRSAGQVTLSTIHRAKGLEWDTVVNLDPWRIPSKWARFSQDRGDPVPMQQEMNLRYVCETRAKHTLINASLENFS